MYDINQLKALQSFANNSTAEKLLADIAGQVLPILTRRKWKVSELREFFPKDTRLLGMNVNRGQKILIRLRPAHQPTAFYPFGELLGTMLHELAHMEIGPHNAEFFKLLSILKKEAESLMMEGLAGTVGVKFQNAGKGMTLGGSKILEGSCRRVAALAAEKRQHYRGLIGNKSGCSLGGHIVVGKKSRRDILYEAAHKRSCRYSSSTSTVRHLPEIESSSSNVVCIDLTEDDSDVSFWECELCTLVNSIQDLSCSVCSYTRTANPNVVIDLT